MELKVSQNGNIKLYNNLLNIDEKDAFYNQHKMRSPVETLLNKVRAVDTSLEILLSKIELPDFDHSKDKAIFDYIESINLLYDGLLLIIKATSQFDDSQENEKDIKDWLNKNNHKDFTSFKDVTSAEHKFIRNAANHIKHDDVRVDYLKLTNHKGKKVSGFYLSKIVNNEQLSGSLADIHNEYKGSTTAFSYNHFLLRSLGVIALYFYTLNKILFEKSASINKAENIFFSLFSKVVDIKYEFFPDEYKIKFGEFSSVKNGAIIIKYPHRYSGKEKFDLIDNICPTMRFDQSGNSKYQYPYWKLLNNRVKTNS